MQFPLRRVVTGHDAQGRSKVVFDDAGAPVVSKRSGHQSNVVWTSTGFPVDNDSDTDTAAAKVETTLTDGTIFRIMRIEPGVAPRRHRSDSIDYLVVLSGEVTMELDIGSVHLKTGDTLVQRGTMHNWVVTGSEPCIMAVVLIDAKSATAQGKSLSASG